jgi:hypothetical protein
VIWLSKLARKLRRTPDATAPVWTAEEVRELGAPGGLVSGVQEHTAEVRLPPRPVPVLAPAPAPVAVTPTGPPTGPPAACWRTPPSDLEMARYTAVLDGTRERLVRWKVADLLDQPATTCEVYLDDCWNALQAALGPQDRLWAILILLDEDAERAARNQVAGFGDPAPAGPHVPAQLPADPSADLPADGWFQDRGIPWTTV